MRIARGVSHGGERSCGLQRHLQQGLNAMRDGVFQGGQRGQLSRQLPKLLGTCATQELGRAKRLRTDTGAHLRTNTDQEKKRQRHRRDQKTTGERAEGGPTNADLPSDAYPHFQVDAGV